MSGAGGRFAGRRALVTGASRGIGAGIAERLAAEGAAVAVVARTLDHHDHLPGSLRETEARLRAHGADVVVVVADLADPDGRAEVVPQAAAALGGPIDVLVNNAAAAMYGSLRELTLKRRRLMFEVNVHCPVDLAQAVVPGMVERGEGWIVNLSSASSRLAEGPPFPVTPVAATIGAYGASKAALDRIMNGLALELHGTGVRVNQVEPRAAVMTEGADALVGGSVRADQIESLEAMVEAVAALCDCPPDLTGRVCVSLDLIEELGLDVHGLDGRPLPETSAR